MKSLVLLALLLAGCTTPGTETSKPDPKMLDEARAVAKRLVSQLGGRLMQEMSSNGPEAAISVCKNTAPQIAADLSKQTGWKVGRVGTRVRNPESGTPDAWETRTLDLFAERMSRGEKPDTMEQAEVIRDSSGTYLRYAKAIAVQPVCTVCHGDVDALPQGVRERLQANYPMDKATGYKVGELRGAVVIKRPL